MKHALIGSFALAIAVIAGCGGDGKVTPIDAPMADTPTIDPAMLTIDRTSHQFGSVTLGELSPPTTFTITNTGDLPTGTLQPALTGADAASFALPTAGCMTKLQPGASCMVTVLFAPLAPGHKTATLTIAGTPGGMVSATLDGDGVALGALTVSTSISDLGSVVVGQTSTLVSTFTVTNTGGTPSGALSIQPAGSDPGEFVTSADLCSTVMLAAAATCTFQVRFTPHAAGAKAALFQISGAPGGTVSGAVTGVGLEPASLIVVPLQLDFGSVVVGQTSATLTALVTNIGGVPTGVLAQTVTGADAAMFMALGCNGATLAAGTSCTVMVQFSPTSIGGHSALLSFLGVPGGSVATTLGGIGIPAGQLSISPSAHAFANTNLGQSAAAQLFTITNNGAAATGSLSTTLGGSQVGEFQIIAGSDGCSGTSLAAGAQCTISVTFLPTIGGVAHASITIAAAPGGSVTAGLSGFGVSGASIAIAPPSRSFGSIPLGGQSAPLSFTVSNTGGQVSGVPAVTLSGAGAGEFAIAGSTCTQTLAPGATCTIQVKFAPTMIGTPSATLGVVASPGGSVSADVTGDAIADGGLVIIPSSYEFPVVAVGDTDTPQTLTVQNLGEATTGPILLTVTGPNANEFTIASTTCTTLAPLETCTVTVVFAPQGIGTRTATLTASATPGGVATAALSGVSRPRIEIIAINSGPVVDPYDFGVSTVNNTIPQDVLITVRNNTSGIKPFNIAEAFGAPAQFLTISNTCVTTIAGPGGTCTVGVRFKPTSVGPKLGTITFSIGAGPFDSAAEHLTGTGTSGLTLTALNGTDFGSIPINTVSGILRFRLTNAPGSILTGPVSITLTAGPFQLVADPCSGLALAAGDSCLLDVRFAPTVVGSAMATLAASATPGGAPSLVLTGIGVTPTGSPPTDILLNPHSIAENSPSGSTVGTLTTIDPDPSQTFTYTLVPGAGSTDNTSFTIVNDIVHTVGVFDYETKNLYTIRVRSTDSGGQFFEKPLLIDVLDVDEPPVAVNDSYVVVEDSGANSFDVLANDTDVDGGPKFVQSVTQPAHGSVVIIGGGSSVTYTPAPNYFGPDAFTYTLNGGSLATVSISVTPVDDPPVAVDDTLTIPEDNGPTPINVLANDTDIDGGPMQITSVTPVAHGTLVITGGGTGVTYTPAANYNGPDGFTYTLNGGSMAMVAITVTPVDDPPVAVNDSFTLLEDTTFTFDPTANDTDVDGGPKMIISLTQPTFGTATLVAGGVKYQPNPNYFGPDAYTYTLNGGSSATVSIIVTPVDDPPMAVDDAATVPENSPATTLDLLSNDLDIDGGPKSIASTTQPAHGTVVLAGNMLSVTYQPQAGYCNSQSGGAPDTFTYTLNGGSMATVSVTVTCDVLGMPTTPPLDPGSHPQAIARGDFNGDGKLDLAVALVTTDTVDILLGVGDGSFQVPMPFGTGAAPVALAAGDFNGDGNLDLAVVDANSNDVRVFLGNGTGAYMAFTSFAVGLNPSALVVADLDRDGDLDLAVTNSGSSSASILLGTGTGSFAAATSVAFGAQPSAIAVGDIDRDGTLDLAVANSGASSVGVRFGTGTGTFGAMTTIAVGNAPSGVALADLDGDGTLDVIASNRGSNTVSLARKNPGGGFGLASSTAVGTGPSAVATADFNADGKLDVIVTNETSSTVTVLPNAGAGTFGAAMTAIVGSTPRALVTGDLNADGKADVAIATFGASNVSVLLGLIGNNASGTFAAPTGLAAFPPQGVAIGDLDGNGLPDFAYAATTSNQVGVILQTGAGFGAAATFQSGLDPVALALGDLNRDGKLDIVTADATGGTVSILLGTGTGAYGLPTILPVGTSPSAVAIADLDRNGTLDLIVANSGSNTVSVLLGTGTGTFGAPTSFAVGTAPRSVAVADLDRDGKLDLVVANGGGTVSLLIGTGTGSFGAATPFAAGMGPSAVAVADLDRDGKLDLAVTSSGDGNVNVLRNTGAGFGAPASFAVGTAPGGIAIGDLNGDGKPDLAVSNAGSASISVLLNTGASFGGASSFGVGAGPSSVGIADLNRDGKLDLAASCTAGGQLSVRLGL